jgi:hypothetical protein
MTVIRGMAFDRATVSHIALDKASVRSKDRDGRLHISTSNISKSTVDPYYGHEIPDFEALKLDPEKIYYLLRDAGELEKAAPTFNNLPILSEHIPVSADAPQSDLIIGSTGTDARFAPPYLQNSAVVWVGDAIEDIEAERKKEWSCGYYYTADMTPGVFNGLRYDGVMRDIVGNHVALVDQGRAGPDVVVGDRLPGKLKMAILKSRRALMLNGALVAFLAPKIAQDKALDLSDVLGSVNAETIGKTKKAVATLIVAKAKPLLAQDGELDVDDVVKLIGAVEGAEVDPAEDDEISDTPAADPAATPAVDADGDKLSKVLAFLEGKLSDEDMAAIGDMCAEGAADDLPDAPSDDPDDKKDQPKAKPAMDAKAVGRTIAMMRLAEREVSPHIGEIKVSVDSPEAIYKMALDHAKVDLAGVHKSAYRSLVRMLPKPSETAAPMALDHAKANNDFASRFPTANTLIPS